MSYFEGQSPRWAQHGRQQSWDPSQGPRSGMRSQGPSPPSALAYAWEDASPSTPRDDSPAFGSQFDEITRASDNLSKGGRGFAAHNRRESVPVPGSFARQYSEFDSRLTGPPRHHSVSDFDGIRSHSSHSSSSLQGYLSNQRFGAGPRMSEAEQMMQAKRRAAAQRERELRNYHQEQQYNRNLSTAKSDRSMSPSAMSEEDRRELIARQHRALYGNDSNLYTGDSASPHQISQDARVLPSGSSAHAPSPLAFDQYGVPSSGASDSGASVPAIASAQSRSRSNSNASPAGTQGTFQTYEGNQSGAPRTGSSSPGGSPTRGGAKAAATTGVAPIGTRPIAQAKRNTPPMPSPLSYGFGNEKSNPAQNERSQSSASNPTTSQTEKPVNLGWGSSGNNNQGPWGNSGKMQASVWG